METIRKVHYKGHDIEIWQDCDPLNPRTDWDNFGTMVFFHKRYDLGDKNHGINDSDFSGWDEMESYIEKEFKPLIILPVRMYDHSGISISCSDSYPFNCPWDSGMIGFIFVSREKVKQEYKVKTISAKLKEQVKEMLLGEVKTYNDYLTGEVFGWSVLDDSCGGYYGENISYGIEEAKKIVDHYVARELEETAKDVSSNSMRSSLAFA